MTISTKKRWQIVIVRRPPRFCPKSWRDVPNDAKELAVASCGPSRAVALSWCRGFNDAELANPQGVWAIVRRVDPPPPPPVSRPTANGQGKP
jgi:hypothetical protein